MSSDQRPSAPAQPLAGQRVAIVGAGLAGSLLALYLGQQGCEVDVYERRPDPRRGGAAGGRSINLGLSKRGMQALAEVGLLDTVLARAVAMQGRIIHRPDGKVRFHPYGKNRREVLHSIDRNELNRLLLERAAALPAVRLHFGRRLTGLDKEARRLELVDEASGETSRVAADFVIGADGAFSRVRPEMQRGERADYHQEFLAWGYKELTLRGLPGGGSAIALEALHVWPRVHGLVVSHANRDGSHTLTLFLPFAGPDGFDSIDSDAAVTALFDRYFPDLAALLPDLLAQWREHPAGALVTTRTRPWRWQDWVVLVGDACHAVYPFYGQGMNAAFEDCSALVNALGRAPAGGGSRAAAFAAYEEARRPHTDTLARLSEENFFELSRRVRSPLFVLRKRLDVVLNRLLPRAWLPLYTMITHTTLPYGEALARARRQQRWLALGTAAVAAVLLLLAWGGRSG